MRASLIALLGLAALGACWLVWWLRRQEQPCCWPCGATKHPGETGVDKECSSAADLGCSETVTAEEAPCPADWSILSSSPQRQRNNSLLLTLDAVERGLRSMDPSGSFDSSENDGGGGESPGEEYFSTREECDDEVDDAGSINSNSSHHRIAIFESDDDDDSEGETESVRSVRSSLRQQQPISKTLLDDYDNERSSAAITQQQHQHQDAWNEFQLRNSLHLEEEQASLYKLWSASSVRDSHPTAAMKRRWSLSEKPVGSHTTSNKSFPKQPQRQPQQQQQLQRQTSLPCPRKTARSPAKFTRHEI